MVAPSGEGAVRCMRLAMQGLGNTPVDYINAHGTSTPVGDITELKAIREAFGADMPRVSSTKSLTGHSQGATGVHEAIYSLLMLDNRFVAASAHIENLDPAAECMPIVRPETGIPSTRAGGFEDVVVMVVGSSLKKNK